MHLIILFTIKVQSPDFFGLVKCLIDGAYAPCPCALSAFHPASYTGCLGAETRRRWIGVTANGQGNQAAAPRTLALDQRVTLPLERSGLPGVESIIKEVDEACSGRRFLGRR